MGEALIAANALHVHRTYHAQTSLAPFCVYLRTAHHLLRHRVRKRSHLLSAFSLFFHSGNQREIRVVREGRGENSRSNARGMGVVEWISFFAFLDFFHFYIFILTFIFVFLIILVLSFYCCIFICISIYFMFLFLFQFIFINSYICFLFIYVFSSIIVFLIVLH